MDTARWTKRPPYEEGHWANTFQDVIYLCYFDQEIDGLVIAPDGGDPQPVADLLAHTLYWIKLPPLPPDAFQR